MFPQVLNYGPIHPKTPLFTSVEPLYKPTSFVKKKEEEDFYAILAATSCPWFFETLLRHYGVRYLFSGAVKKFCYARLQNFHCRNIRLTKLQFRLHTYQVSNYNEILFISHAKTKNLKMERTTMILGSYVDASEQDECLVLRFSSTILSLRHQWLNNSVIANFLAEYWNTLALSCHELAHRPVGNLKEVISYTVNELLDNAIKYGCVSPDNATQVTVRFVLLPQHIRVYVTNASFAQNGTSFHDYIKILLTEDPEVLYFRQMEENAASREHTVSRLGLLSIMHDYHGQIGWKFELPSQTCRDYLITTMAQIPITC